MMNDPATTPRNRFGVYFFFLGHIGFFGAFTFYLTYHEQQQDAFVTGLLPVVGYVLFYVLMFGVQEIAWLAITFVLGLLMIDSWLEVLATPFVPPVAVGDWTITEFENFPRGRHIVPSIYLVMYQFLLRNLLLDTLGARTNPGRNRLVGGLFVAISVVQIVVAKWLW